MGGRSDLLLDRFSSMAPFHVVKLSADKHLCKHLLRRKGIEVPDGGRFTGRTVDDAMDAAEAIGYPVVVKPNRGSHGDGVRVGLRTPDRLEACLWEFAALRGPDEPFIVESFHPWPEHRVFASRSGGFAAVRRVPAHVVGDGTSTVQELAGLESARREEIRAVRETSLCPLVLDREAASHLRAQGFSGFSHVPAAGEEVFLRQQSNLAKGGVAVGVTAKAHPSVRAMAARVLDALPGMPCVGIDLLCADISADLVPGGYAVIEVNSNPGLAMHAFPGEGEAIDVAAMVVDAMFPWLAAV
jgi:cyanophycin synthetase